MYFGNRVVSVECYLPSDITQFDLDISFPDSLLMSQSVFWRHSGRSLHFVKLKNAVTCDYSISGVHHLGCGKSRKLSSI